MKAAPSIWWFAFGYFACYAPYSALTKAVSKGLLPSMDSGISGFSMLPCSVMASFVGMLIFLTVMGWWKHATHREVLGMNLPTPRGVTLASGLCTAVIIGTTTLAYTFSGVSIVFMMLLMRGGVLVLAPIVDVVSGRKSRWFSWAALALSLGALVVTFSERGGYAITVVAAVDVTAYLAGYFFRLRIMSAKAKSEDPAENIRYFVEEQLVATPAVLILLVVVALIGQGDVMLEVRAGFTTFFSDSGVVPYTILIGFLSQGTGVCGGLILLDKRENTFSVPVNRCSSILAGVVAAWLLTLVLGNDPPSAHKMAGAGLIVCAILFLSIPPLLEKNKAKRAAAAAAAAGGQS